MAKDEKDKQTIIVHMTQYRKLKNKQHEPHQKLRGDLRWSGRVSRSCSTSGISRVAYVITNPVNSLIWLVTYFLYNFKIYQWAISNKVELDRNIQKKKTRTMSFLSKLNTHNWTGKLAHYWKKVIYQSIHLLLNTIFQRYFSCHDLLGRG